MILWHDCLASVLINDFIALLFCIQDGQSRTIRQFQFTDWPEQGVPKSGEGFIDFIGQVHKTKEQFGQEGPITVHCRWVCIRQSCAFSSSFVSRRESVCVCGVVLCCVHVVCVRMRCVCVCVRTCMFVCAYVLLYLWGTLICVCICVCVTVSVRYLNLYRFHG